MEACVNFQGRTNICSFVALWRRPSVEPNKYTFSAVFLAQTAGESAWVCASSRAEIPETAAYNSSEKSSSVYYFSVQSLFSLYQTFLNYGVNHDAQLEFL
jgi:hypothetical protein